MPVLITKKFRFEAAHWLPTMPDGHKCRNVHGHSFYIEVNVTGDIDPDTGLLMAFGDIKKVVMPYIDLLDHRCINDVGVEQDNALLKNPSSENLAKWFFDTLEPQLPGLFSIVVQETSTVRCEYRKTKFE
ncbi:MAG: 6-carboxytetrahydropterin synthase QueD [Bacteroidota bacterium]